MRQAPPPVAQNTTAALYNFGDKSQVLIRDTANNLIIGIDTHQNKHQHPNALIPQLGTWIRKKGSTFAKGKGLEWHRNNTAKTMQTWAKANLPIAQQIYLQKQPLSDGYIYDATLFMDLGVAVVTYHCNPPKNE